jgi:[ribosomal protein S18]-alanine N-acetyltransferase
MQDDIDQIMELMQASFDPAYGEAWTRRQVSDALLMGNLVGNCRYLLANDTGNQPSADEQVAGFTLSRQVLDEEELLLLAVRPDARRRGVASRLITRLVNSAAEAGVSTLFLEMREGNSAEILYKSVGFSAIGRRRSYYRFADGSQADAITFKLEF